jgi:GxxExxY protein
MLELDDVTGVIVDTSIQIHRRIGSGLLESLYVTILTCELRRRGLRVDRERTISICYDGVIMEDAFRADLIVEDCVIVEVKSVERLAAVYQKQLLTYLRLTDLRVGLLLNFGAELMKDGVKRVVNNFTPGDSSFLRINRPPES